MTTSHTPEDIMKTAGECAQASVERPYNAKSTERAALNIARAIHAERERNEARIRELEAQLASWVETVNRQEKAIAAAADQHAAAIQRERQRCAEIARQAEASAMLDFGASLPDVQSVCREIAAAILKGAPNDH